MSQPPKSKKLNMNVIRDSDDDSDDNESIETTVPDKPEKFQKDLRKNAIYES